MGTHPFSDNTYRNRRSRVQDVALCLCISVSDWPMRLLCGGACSNGLLWLTGDDASHTAPTWVRCTFFQFSLPAWRRKCRSSEMRTSILLRGWGKSVCRNCCFCPKYGGLLPSESVGQSCCGAQIENMARACFYFRREIGHSGVIKRHSSTFMAGCEWITKRAALSVYQQIAVCCVCLFENAFVTLTEKFNLRAAYSFAGRTKVWINFALMQCAPLLVFGFEFSASPPREWF